MPRTSGPNSKTNQSNDGNATKIEVRVSKISKRISSADPLVGQLPLFEDIEALEKYTEDTERDMENASEIPSKYLLGFRDRINGHDYSSLFERWEQWFFGSSPYNIEGTDIIFLRGNMENYRDTSSILDMTFLSGNGHRITNGKYIFVPAITASFNIGDYFEGEKIKDRETLQKAVQDYVLRGGPVWASIEFLNTNEVFILPLKYFETRLFQLHVATENPWRKYVEPVQEAGDYFSLCGGYIVILQPSEGLYRIRFGGIGRHNYRTDAVWDIEVLGTPAETKKLWPEPKSISKFRHPSQILAQKYLSRDKH